MDRPLRPNRAARWAPGTRWGRCVVGASCLAISGCGGPPEITDASTEALTVPATATTPLATPRDADGGVWPRNDREAMASEDPAATGDPGAPTMDPGGDDGPTTGTAGSARWLLAPDEERAWRTELATGSRPDQAVARLLAHLDAVGPDRDRERLAVLDAGLAREPGTVPWMRERARVLFALGRFQAAAHQWIDTSLEADDDARGEDLWHAVRAAEIAGAESIRMRALVVGRTEGLTIPDRAATPGERHLADLAFLRADDGPTEDRIAALRRLRSSPLRDRAAARALADPKSDLRVAGVLAWRGSLAGLEDLCRTQLGDPAPSVRAAAMSRSTALPAATAVELLLAARERSQHPTEDRFYLDLLIDRCGRPPGRVIGNGAAEAAWFRSQIRDRSR